MSSTMEGPQDPTHAQARPGQPSSKGLPAPTPLAGKNQPVDWLFVYKFNSASFPGCTDDGVTPAVGSNGIFGGTVQGYPDGHSQQYVYATSKHQALVQGTGCVGATDSDPLGATFGQVYNTPGYFYVLWNDQFYNNPIANMESPWGHAKGMVAWNDDGEGFVLQVSTPSWPASGSSAYPRQNDGNTLGCIKDDDVEVAQHFFALKLTQGDLAVVLQALANASVATNLGQPSIVRNGGPAGIQNLVNQLGKESKSKTCTVAKLSSGVRLISKPSALAAPPWQLVSSKLNSVPLRVASWWASPAIYSTTASTVIACWPAGLGKAGAVEIATSGMWNGKSIGLKGGEGQNFNHAKVGVSTDKKQPLCIFGDMNQQGALCTNYAHPGQKCNSSQNGRGGTFYVLNDQGLFDSLTRLLAGSTAPAKAPDKPASGTSGAGGTKKKRPGTAKTKAASKSRSSTTKTITAKKKVGSTKKAGAKKKTAARRTAPARSAKRKTARKSTTKK